MSKAIYHAPLTHENAKQIGQQISDLLAAKLFAVARGTAWESSTKIGLQTNLLLQAEWVDKTESLVRVEVDEVFANITFSDGYYTYVLLSRKLSGGDHESFKYPYFVFDPTGFRIAERGPFGVNLHTFRVQGDLPWDTDEYHERLLRIHYNAANLPIPEPAQ